MQTRFIKVTKDNQHRDRGFIAVDAICSVFENHESHNVSIMTMDGFWYDVIDDIEKIYSLVGKSQPTESEENRIPQKKDYFRCKKMLPASVEGDKPKQNHEDLFGKNSCGKEKRQVFKTRKGKNQKCESPIYLSASADEGHLGSDSAMETT